MQLLYPIGLTGEEYVNARAWEYARLAVCPNHPAGGCSLARHGTYGRKTPRRCRVARWYCPESHMTFSLLPECLAARLPGTLSTLEAVVNEAERASSLAAAAAVLRPGPVGLEGAARWVGRRVERVHHVLGVVRGMRPDLLAGCPPRLGAVRLRLRSATALAVLRAELDKQLSAVPAPLGFLPHGLGRRTRRGRIQQRMGPDPPAVAG